MEPFLLGKLIKGAPLLGELTATYPGLHHRAALRAPHRAPHRQWFMIYFFSHWSRWLWRYFGPVLFILGGFLAGYKQCVDVSMSCLLMSFRLIPSVEDPFILCRLSAKIKKKNNIPRAPARGRALGRRSRTRRSLRSIRRRSLSTRRSCSWSAWRLSWLCSRK